MKLDIRSKILVLFLTNWVLLYHIDGWIYWLEVGLILLLMTGLYQQWCKASLYTLYFLAATCYSFFYRKLRAMAGRYSYHLSLSVFVSYCLAS